MPAWKLPGVYLVLGATEAQARQHKADLDDQLDLDYLKGSLRSNRSSGT